MLLSLLLLFDLELKPCPYVNALTLIMTSCSFYKSVVYQLYPFSVLVQPVYLGLLSLTPAPLQLAE